MAASQEQVEGQCGACGYDVRGLPSARCPECGSDLGVVGVWKQVRRRAPFWHWMLFWGMLVVITVLEFGGVIVNRYGSFYRRADTSLVMELSLISTENSESARGRKGGGTGTLTMSVDAVGKVSYWAWDPPAAVSAHEMTIKLDGANAYRIEVGGSRQTARLVDAKGNQSRVEDTVTPAMMIALYEASHGKPADEETRQFLEVAAAEMVSVSNTMQCRAMSIFPKSENEQIIVSRHGSIGSRSGPDWRTHLTTAGVAMLVWALGLPFLKRAAKWFDRRRRVRVTLSASD